MKKRYMEPEKLTETQEHIRFGKLLDRLSLLWTHSPMGGPRDPRSAAILKQMGARKGFPDFCIFEPRLPTSAGLAIELKARTGQPQSKTKKWFDDMAVCGWDVKFNRDGTPRQMLCKSTPKLALPEPPKSSLYPSIEQVAWLISLTRKGYSGGIAWGRTPALDMVHSYLKYGGWN